MRVSDIQQVLTGLLGQSGKNEKKELVPGSVITALLKEIKGNMALLNYLGTDFVARLETDAPAGERLRFFVEGKKDGQTVLKLLGNEKESNNLILSAIVKDLGLSDEPVNLKIVGEMLKQKMPLDPGVAGKISTFVRNLNIAEQNMWIPVFMHNSHIPLNQQNYRQVSALVNDIQYLQEDIKSLSAWIAKLGSAADPKGELGQLTASVSKLLAQFKLDPKEGSLNTIQKLSTIFRTLMPQAGPTTSVVSHSQAVHVVNVMPEAKAQTEPVKPLSQTATNVPVVSGSTIVSDSSEVSDSPAVPGSPVVSDSPAVPGSQAVSDLRVLQSSHLNLDSLLHKLTVILRENGEPEHKEVLRLIQDLSDKLDFIRNFNSNSEPGRENMIVMYSSVKFDENEAPFRLLVKHRQENRDKEKSFTSCRMEIRLNTPGLGLVKCEVQVVEKNLTIQFVGASESTVSFIDCFTGLLVNRLGQLKFNVNLLPTRASVEKENDFSSWETGDIPGLFQINLKI